MSPSSGKSSSGPARSSTCVFALAMMNWFSAPAVATAVEGSPRAEEFLDGGEHVHQQVAVDVPVSAVVEDEVSFDGSCPHEAAKPEEQAAEALSSTTEEDAGEGEGGPPIKAAAQRQSSAGFLQKRSDAEGVQPELQPAAAFQFLRYLASGGGGGEQKEDAADVVVEGHGGGEEQATATPATQLKLSHTEAEPPRAAAVGFLQRRPESEGLLSWSAGAKTEIPRTASISELQTGEKSTVVINNDERESETAAAESPKTQEQPRSGLSAALMALIWPVIQGAMQGALGDRSKPLDEHIVNWAADLLQGHLGPFMFELHVSEVPLGEQNGQGHERKRRAKDLEETKASIPERVREFLVNGSQQGARLMKVSVEMKVAELNGSGRDPVIETITTKLQAFSGLASFLVGSFFFVEFPCGIWIGSDSRLIRKYLLGSYGLFLRNCESAEEESVRLEKEQEFTLAHLMSADFKSLDFDSCRCKLETSVKEEVVEAPEKRITEVEFLEHLTELRSSSANEARLGRRLAVCGLRTEGIGKLARVFGSACMCASVGFDRTAERRIYLRDTGQHKLNPGEALICGVMVASPAFCQLLFLPCVSHFQPVGCQSWG